MNAIEYVADTEYFSAGYMNACRQSCRRKNDWWKEWKIVIKKGLQREKNLVQQASHLLKKL